MVRILEVEAPGQYILECAWCEGRGLAVLTIDPRTLAVKTYARNDTCFQCSGKGVLRARATDTLIPHAACQGTGKILKTGLLDFLTPGSQVIKLCTACWGLGVVAITGRVEHVK